MCIKCHSSLSNELILKHLKEELDSGAKNFSLYNSTSISHLIISASGYNGCDIRNKAITLLNKYNEWLILNPSYILEESLSSQYLMPMIERIKNNKIDHNDTDLEDYLRTIFNN